MLSKFSASTLKRGNVPISTEPRVDLAYDVLDEFRIVERAFGDEFLVFALQQRIDVAGRRTFHDR